MVFFQKECDNWTKNVCIIYVQTKIIANTRPAIIPKKKPANEDENGISEGVAYHQIFQESY